MATILGIDAAWRVGNPTGVALITSANGRWHCRRVCPTAHAFIESAFGPRQWPRIYLMEALVSELIRAAAAFAGEPVTLVALDLPLSLAPFQGRRVADNEVSRLYGRYGCPTHSPTADCPGPLGEAYSDALLREGFALRTAADDLHFPGAIEVYPHTAILTMLNAEFRLPYKVAKTTRFWPGVARPVRRRLILGVLQTILTRLQEDIDIEMYLPLPDDGGTFTALKQFEDMIDSLVCAWVGIRHMEGATHPIGDQGAAIWVPHDGRIFQ